MTDTETTQFVASMLVDELLVDMCILHTILKLCAAQLRSRGYRLSFYHIHLHQTWASVNPVCSSEGYQISWSILFILLSEWLRNRKILTSFNGSSNLGSIQLFLPKRQEGFNLRVLRLSESSKGASRNRSSTQDREDGCIAIKGYSGEPSGRLI